MPGAGIFAVILVAALAIGAAAVAGAALRRLRRLESGAAPGEAREAPSPLHVNALILAGAAVFVIMVPTGIEAALDGQNSLPTVAWSAATSLASVLITLATNCLRAKFPHLKSAGDE